MIVLFGIFMVMQLCIVILITKAPLLTLYTLLKRALKFWRQQQKELVSFKKFQIGTTQLSVNRITSSSKILIKAFLNGTQIYKQKKVEMQKFMLYLTITIK